MFKIYLRDDDITIASKDGAVTLTGIDFVEYHKPLAPGTMAGLPGVTNRLEVKDGQSTTVGGSTYRFEQLHEKGRTAVRPFSLNSTVQCRDLAAYP